ncbi:hypothetical protein AVEN_28369-1 [Araneus ventricosus]|uniref:Uncharacterized protein n=1 Tax=Araneus ventricosus TaxID=182803 RepID=A0A4Y1ZMI5_ARAVE|nr:hypothetical protein AVEN_28369-1 [Araneus ventricosus]
MKASLLGWKGRTDGGSSFFSFWGVLDIIEGGERDSWRGRELKVPCEDESFSSGDDAAIVDPLHSMCRCDDFPCQKVLPQRQLQSLSVKYPF